MLSDERLRQVYKDALRVRRATTRSGCVAPEALLAVVRRDGADAARMETVDHALACAECRAELELLRAIERAGGAKARVPLSSGPWRRRVTLALAASVLLAIGLGPGRRLLERGDAVDTLRGGGADVVAIAPPTDARIAHGGDLTFTWHPLAGARGYTVEILAPDGELMLARETAETTLVLRQTPALAPGTYRWWVRGSGNDGTEHRSELRRIRIDRAPEPTRLTRASAPPFATR